MKVQQPEPRAGARVEIEATVIKVRARRGEDWAVGDLETKIGVFGFIGTFFGEAGDLLRIKGLWEVDPRTKRLQVRIRSSEQVTDLDREGIVRLLSKSDKFPGIGESRARRLVDAAGEEGFESALERPGVLAERSGMSLELVESVATEWMQRQEMCRTMAGLAEFKVTPNQAERLWKAHGPGVLLIVRNNPYWLIGRVKRFGFKTVDDIAMKVGVPRDSPIRMEHACLYALREDVLNGHTWTDLRMLVRKVEELLGLDVGNARTLIENCVLRIGRKLEGECDHAGAFRILSVGRIRTIWQSGLWEDERFVFGRIASGLGGSRRYGDRDQLAERLLAAQPSLNEGQVSAAVTALTSRISVVTGGAGVGKTFLVGAILEVAQQDGISFALCAPTGKAARRMVDSTGWSASTIHRLLEAIPPSGMKRKGLDDDEEDGGDEAPGPDRWSFARDAQNPLDCQLLVVDEVSMVDSRLCASLLRAVDLRRTSVIFVGDHHQLPPVGPGSILRDLVASGGELCPVAELTQIVRQAGILKINVSKILEGKVIRGGKRRSEIGELIQPWYVLDYLETPAAVAAAIVQIFRDRLSGYSILTSSGEERVDPVWDVQLLTPYNKGELGTVALNKPLQALFQGRLGRTVSPVPTARRARPMIDDKVIQTRNDYDLDVMNGTLGRVVHLAKDEGPFRHGDEHFHLEPGDMLVEFESGTVVVPPNAQIHVQLAYALTVHKAQGSEFPVVVVVVHRLHSFMHNRGLLYTAVSRARQSCLMVGDAGGLRNCASKEVRTRRRTLASLAAQEGIPLDDVFAAGAEGTRVSGGNVG